MDFFCIGAPRAGTTWLHNQLRAHPDFEMTPKKELDFFNRMPKYLPNDARTEHRLLFRIFYMRWTWRALKDCYRAAKKKDLKTLRWWIKWHFSDFTAQWYDSLFAPSPKITGDISPRYSLLKEEEVARMARLYPQAKIVYMLRNPVERAWSGCQKDMRKKGLHLKTKEDFKAYFNQPKKIRVNEYLKTIALYARYFPPENILICFNDVLKSQPLEFVENVVQFLGGKKEKVKENCPYDTVINSHHHQEIPPWLSDYLFLKYKADMEKLAQKIGSYSLLWLGKKLDENMLPLEPFPLIGEKMQAS